jgi:beta-glucosidase
MGADMSSVWRQAYDQSLIVNSQLDNAVVHALELQFKLGLFENPYVDIAAATAFWDPNGAAMQNRVAAGKAAMRKAIVLVKNTELAPGVDLLPVIKAMGDYVDANGNGTIDVYFDSAFAGSYDSGQANTYATTTRYPNRNFVASIDDADVAIVRIFARGGVYFGTTGGVPLSYDGVTHVWDHATHSYTSALASDTTRTGSGEPGYRAYTNSNNSLNRLLAVLNAKAARPVDRPLKVIVGMTAARPGILAPYLSQIDGLLIDFGATDDAFLDDVFFNEGAKPMGRLPVEIPADDASVEVQYEDVPCDTANPSFPCGFGLSYRNPNTY